MGQQGGWLGLVLVLIFAFLLTAAAAWSGATQNKDYQH
jgi:hypothetical protein